jgi:hypothetical protein
MALSLGVLADSEFGARKLASPSTNRLSPSSVEMGRQGRVAAVGEHASDLLRQDAF